MARAQPARHGGSPVYLALFNLIVGCFSFVGIIVLISVGYWLGPVWNFMLLACLIASLAHVVVVAQGVCRPEREARRVQARVANAVFAITALMAIAVNAASAARWRSTVARVRVRCDASQSDDSGSSTAASQSAFVADDRRRSLGRLGMSLPSRGAAAPSVREMRRSRDEPDEEAVAQRLRRMSR
ncbi:hypothetical protein JL720_1465 [Aureococcus anophagefferens]|nr:hypothetical protein JL720_1465 [Aureococcus anophagefferens]